MKKLYLLLVLIICLSNAIFATDTKSAKKAISRPDINFSNQTGSIQGKITDKQDSETIPFANVILELNNTIEASTSSDIDGRYRVSGVSSGRYNLKVSFVGYKPVLIKDVIISPDKITFLNIKMESTTETLKEVVIREYAVPMISKDQTSTGGTVTSEEIRKMPGRSSKSISSSLRGVSSADGEVGSVRGCRTGGTITYIDGVRVNSSSSSSSASKIKSPKPTSTSANPFQPISNDNIKNISPANNTKGKLTASELNDFSKWKLWQDINQNDLKLFKNLWRISPLKRYSVQIKGNDEKPVIDATVLLKSLEGELIWSAKTDNTGKAELWLNIFSDIKYKKLKLIVSYENKEYSFSNPYLFKKGINVYKIPVQCNIPNQIDIAFVVDATSSMKDEIAFLKSDLIDIIHKTKANFTDVSINLGSVFYRCYGNSYVTRMSPFTNNIENGINFINDQKAEEGGDEVVEEALRVAIDSLKWNQTSRARLLFFVLDEQPLKKPEIIDELHVYIQEAASKGIRVIPVIASAETKSNAYSLEYLMRSIALATNGTYVFLTDHSNIGEAHAKPTTDQYDVELLNHLLERIIYHFCYIPGCDEKINTDEISDTTYFSNSPIIAHVVIDTSRTKGTKTAKLFINNYTSDTIQNSIIKENLPDSVQEVNLTASNNTPDVKVIGVSFFPNPTSGIINLEIEGKIDELYLSDISGKLISKYKVTNETRLKIDLSKYSTGLYFLKFCNNNKWYTGKIVLTH